MRKLKITGVLRTVLLVLTVTGILLFFLLTAMDRRKLQRTVDDTIAFARARIQRYEDFNTNDKVKSLIRLLDKSTELSRVIAAEGIPDQEKLDRYVEQMRFLSLHGIDSRAQLEEYRKPLLDEIAALTKERHRLYRSEPESLHIQQITSRLQVLRKENRLCGSIERHSLEIEQRMAEALAERQKYIENEKQKGVDRTENRQDAQQRNG